MSELQWPSNPLRNRAENSPNTSRRRASGKDGPQSSASRRTTKTNGRGEDSAKNLGKKRHRCRKDEILRHLGVDPEELAQSPQIAPLLRQNSVHPDRLVQVLRCDTDAESMKFVRLWDSLTPASRSIAGVE